MAGPDRQHVDRGVHAHQVRHHGVGEEWLDEVFGFREGDHGVHAGPITLNQLDVHQADPTALLADAGDQQHLAGIGGGQEVRRYRHRVPVTRIGLPGGLRAQRDHHPAVHLRPDGPVLGEVSREGRTGFRGGTVEESQGHRVGEPRR